MSRDKGRKGRGRQAQESDWAWSFRATILPFPLGTSAGDQHPPHMGSPSLERGTASIHNVSRTMARLLPNRAHTGPSTEQCSQVARPWIITPF